MLTITYEEKTNRKHTGATIKRPIINGYKDDGGSYRGTEKFPMIILHDNLAIREISKANISEIRTCLYEIRYEIENPIDLVNLRLNGTFNKRNDSIFRLDFDIEIEIDADNWDKPFTIKYFATQLISSLRKKGKNIDDTEEDESIAQWGLRARFVEEDDCEQNLGFYVDRTSNLLKDSIVESFTQCFENIDSNILTATFKFPESIKTSAKQYLVYFSQFLMDLGIKAETELRENSNGTFLKVVPESSDEALQNIRDALEVFLKAPAAPDFDSYTSSNGGIAVWQWQANVDHLKSQLRLANATMEAKDTTIQALNLMNFQLQTLLNDVVNIPNEGKEDLINGIVAVGKFEKYGVEINWAEILRRLKRIM